MVETPGIRLLCLDLDGTLLGPDKRVSGGNRAAIERVCAAGLHVAIASGRHPFNVCELLDELGLSHDAVCLSGAYAMLGGREVHRHALTDEAVARVVDIVEAYGCYVSLSGADFNLTAGHIERIGGETRATSAYLRCSGYDELRAQAAKRSGRILKAAVHAEDDATYEQVRARLRAVPGLEVAQSDVLWSDACPSGCTKSEGIEALAHALGIAMDQVAAVGDDENDVASLAAVGLGIAMGNALPAAKEAAKLVVSDNEHDGVAEAIDLILLRKGE